MCFRLLFNDQKRRNIQTARIPCTCLDKVIGNHIANPPRLVGNHALEGLQEIGLALLWRKLLCNGDEVGNCQQTDRVLLVLRKLVEQWDDVRDKVLLANFLGEALNELYKQMQESGINAYSPIVPLDIPSSMFEYCA